MYNIDDLKPFIRYKTSRSGGSGGQHVNKVATKVELLFDLEGSGLSIAEKQRIRTKLQQRIQSEGLIQVVCQQDRSQLKNKEYAQQKLLVLINHALQIPKNRKETKRSKASVERRLADKKHKALLKIGRKMLD